MENLVKRTISVILLLVIYILIANLANKVFVADGWSEEKSVYMNIFCSCISIFVTIFYKFIVLKFFDLEDKKAVDYILSLVIFLIAGIFLCYIADRFFRCNVFMSGQERFDSILNIFEFCIQSLYMYIIGNSAYVLICYIKWSIREREQGDMLRRGILAMVLLSVCVFFSKDVVIYGFVIIPLVYYCVSVKFYKDWSSGIECHIISMGIYFSVLVIRSSTLEFSDGSFLVIYHLCTYLLCCFLHFILRRIWCAIKNKK